MLGLSSPLLPSRDGFPKRGAERSKAKRNFSYSDPDMEALHEFLSLQHGLQLQGSTLLGVLIIAVFLAYL